MDRNRLQFVALLISLWVALMSAAAFAATGTVTPGTVSENGQRVRVAWSGLGAGKPVFIQQCNNDTGAAYDQFVDCSLISAQERNGTKYNGAGSGATGATDASGDNPDYPVFTGPEITGDLGWGCGPQGTPEGTLVDGVKLYNPCRIRVTDSSLNTMTNEFFLPISFQAGPAPVIPEAKVAALLPVGGALILGTAFLVVRRRHSSPAEA